MNYSKRQMEYIYLPIEKVVNPTINQLDKLLDKAKLINDYRTFYFLLDKWGEWSVEQC